tara:strand:+ start:677 stop:898 length:222 start_codon:yes stop_codon:yes gene_type:complete
MQQKMAAQAAKKKGFKSLGEVSEISGVSRQTLVNWFNNKRRLFDIVIAGSPQFDLLILEPDGQQKIKVKSDGG